MLRLKLLLLVAIFVYSGCIVIPTYQPHISFKATHEDEQHLQMNNVLLIGTGPVASRVFLDNLSAEMMDYFTNKGVRSGFSHIGKVPSNSPLNMDSLVHAHFDMYLVFKTKERSYLNMSKQKYTAYGLGGIVATGYGNQYSETYTVMLYAKKEKMKMIWTGNLDVDFDLAQSHRYKQISKLICDALVKDKILLN